jgi:ornithine carbamoyltransferase
MEKKDLLSITDLTSIDINLLISGAMDLRHQGRRSDLAGKTLALLFEKPSLRTRVSFEMAMRELGGDVLYLSPAEVGLGKREPVADVARVLSRYVDILAVRTFSQDVLTELADYASIPVVNALSDAEHPCQALADLLTIVDHKRSLKGIRLAFVGDGNNVARSLAFACALMGMDFRLATPAGYELDDASLRRARACADECGAGVHTTSDPREAVAGADVVYADTWTSMGQEAEGEKRRADFAGFQVDSALMALARRDAIFMHCLPAHRGEETTGEVMESLASVVFDQAENRVHAQKAVLLELLGGTGVPACRGT